MESRTIDIAKTASIDMMTLNNKVVNMRQVVKRTKVHVISKLCKHIYALKKKQGTEEQKDKNLRKAQRFIEEIDSIKKLKEDKVSKYALANTSTFGDVSKMSLLPGARALARLADHALMKKVVTDFRDQHTDWRDLAAYLLVKQTGRRFKTKKQKQKKLARCIENMNASEVMTKAYIQERFGQEGLAKAEQTFERKRKRQKSVVAGNHGDSKHGSNGNHTDSQKKKKHKTEITHSEDNGMGVLIENMQPQKKMSKNNDACSKNVQTMIKENENVETMIKENENVETMVKENENGSLGTDMCNQNELQEGNRQKSVGVVYDHSDSSDIERETAHRHRSPERDEISSSENIKHSSQTVDSTDQVTFISDKCISDVDTLETVKDKTKLKNECVVKELRLEGRDVIILGGDDDDGSVSESDNNTHQHSSQSSSDDDDGGKDKHKKHQKQVPDFLTRSHKTVISDPFFAGSEELELGLESTVKADFYASDDDNTDVDMSSDPVQAKSMFYNPGPHRKRGASLGRFRRGWGDMHSNEAKDAPGRFDTRQRDRTVAIDNRGRTFRGGNRGRTFRGGSRGNGSFRAADKKFTSKQTLDRHDSRDGWRAAGTHTRTHRSVGGTAADLQISHTVPTAPPAAEKLHPSWEASKKRRAEQSGITTFQGSKLTFDDDD